MHRTTTGAQRDASARPTSAASSLFRRAGLGGSQTLRSAPAKRPTYLQQILAHRAPRHQFQERIRQLKHELQHQEAMLARQDALVADELWASVAFAVAGVPQPVHSTGMQAASADLDRRTIERELEASRKREAEQGRRLDLLEQALTGVEQTLTGAKLLLAQKDFTLNRPQLALEHESLKHPEDKPPRFLEPTGTPSSVKPTDADARSGVVIDLSLIHI